MTQAPVRERLDVIRGARYWMAEHASEICSTISRPPAETMAAELMPLLEACRYLERNAERILAPRRLDRKQQASWLRGVDVEIRREPLGRVLIIGPSNYPLLLPGVQIMQAIAAGNEVVLKPGRGGAKPAEMLRGALEAGGIGKGVVCFLSESVENVQRVIEEGVDKVLLTGSSATGKVVYRHLAEHGVPCIMELSGEDPVFVREDADPELVVKALRFGLTLNSGNTCIAPKRVFLSKALEPKLASRLQTEFPKLPVSVVANDEEALELAAESDYALGATVFGQPHNAEKLARRIRAGVVVVNDMVMPTADPRLPFGGTGKSGFGVTRGEEGLLELTAVKAIAIQRSRWQPHFDPTHPADEQLMEGFLAGSYGGSLRVRMAGWKKAIRAVLARRKKTKQ